jgi:outer membrane protein TolC
VSTWSAARKGLKAMRHELRGWSSALMVLYTLAAGAQAQGPTSTLNVAAGQSAQGSTDAGPITITLQDALDRARKLEPEFRSAQTELGLAHQDRVQARAALLPSVNQTTGFFYTQSNGTEPGTFVGANGVHEYVSQAIVHQSIAASDFAEYRRLGALESVARARAEIASRGLTVTVVQAYYGLVAAQRKYATAQQGATEAERLFGISQKLENGGEVAHSDTVKAQLQYEQQKRDFQEAELRMSKARLDLAVLVFPTFNQDFTVVDDLRLAPPLPAFPEIEQMAIHDNPQLRAAVEAARATDHEVVAAWGGFLPALSFEYLYGIDANRFATRTDGVRNLGYGATATLQLPVWNWGATLSKVRQAGLRQTQARVVLTAAQRQMLANLHSFFEEARLASAQTDALSRSADLAAESLRLTTLRYQAGEATILEVVDAQNSLVQARNAYDDGQARYRVALANLQTLTGNF